MITIIGAKITQSQHVHTPMALKSTKPLIAAMQNRERHLTKTELKQKIAKLLEEIDQLKLDIEKFASEQNAATQEPHN